MTDIDPGPGWVETNRAGIHNVRFYVVWRANLVKDDRYWVREDKADG